MAEITIRLIPDPETGKKNIIISMRSDEDALPHEHEQMHKAVVDKLLGAGKIKASEIGMITIEREEDEKEPAAPVSSGPQDQRQAVQQGR